MRKPTRRTCKVCREKFTATFDNVWWCCPEHGAIYALELRAKQKIKEAAKRIKEQKEAERPGASAARNDWQSCGLPVTTRHRLSRLSTPISGRVMPICHASVAARPIHLICTAANGIADTSKR